MSSVASRVLFIGLDGGAQAVLRPVFDRGWMPNLAGFWARAASGALRSTEPMVTPVAWTSFSTGCTPLIDPQAEGVVLFDIGGGSSELVRLDRSQATRHGPPLPRIRGWVSLPTGVVTLAERHGGINVTRESYEAMVVEVGGYIAPFLREHGEGGTHGIHMLGTSGTVTTIAGVHLDLKRYDRNRVDGCWMSTAEIAGVVDRLLAMSYEERVASPCIGPDRADLVLAGCAILEAIRRAFPCPRLRVADRGLREGMLVQMMRDDGVWGSGEQAAAG